MNGRFAPSPTGDLHLGNLRTALLAWLFARTDGSRFLLRFEDLDQATARPRFYDSQRRDLELLGLDWDDELRQDDHRDRYAAVVEDLVTRGLTYPCYCTRREIQESAAAPHGDGPEGAYPGTCRSLTAAQRRAHASSGRTPALRLRGPAEPISALDLFHGELSFPVDDVVLVRRDGTPAYNLAVVVDDAHQGVEQVVRGDDLLSSTPRQVHVAASIGVSTPSYAHVPLILAPDGRRLAKRDGAVTMSDRMALGDTPSAIRTWLARSAGIDAQLDDTAADLAGRFDTDRLVRTPWVIETHDLTAHAPVHDPHGEGVRAD